MLDEAYRENFIEQMIEAKGKYNNNDLEKLFVNIAETLFDELGIETEEHETHEDHYDLVHNGKLIEVKESSLNRIGFSKAEQNCDYLIAFIRNKSEDYRDFDFAFLTKDEIEKLPLYNNYKNIFFETYIPSNLVTSFDGMVEKIERVFGLPYKRIDEDEFFSQFDDDIREVLRYLINHEKIKKLSEGFVKDVLEDNGIKVETFGHTNPYDLKDKNYEKRIEVKGSVSEEYSDPINTEDFDILIAVFVLNHNIYYAIHKNTDFTNNRPTIEPEKEFDEEEFMKDYYEAIGRY